MLRLTIHVSAVVYATNLPCRAIDDDFTIVGSTGRTAISGFDGLLLPALTAPDSLVSAGIRPAAFGLLALTDAALIAPLRFATLSIRGQATPSWVDVRPAAMKAWSLTPTFRVGVATSLRLTSARGFAGRVEGVVSLHAVADVDSIWTLSCRLANAVRFGSPLESPLHGPRIHAAIARSIGDHVASAELIVSAGGEPGFLLEAAYNDRNGFRHRDGTSWRDGIPWRASLHTSPLAVAVASRIPIANQLSVASEFSHIENLGFRLMLGVEFVP